MDELITVFTTRDLMEAEMIRMALNEEGIRCEIENEHQAGLTGILEMKVNVLDRDAERAKETINEMDQVESEPFRLVVMAFDGETIADEVQLALQKLERSYLIDLKDSVVIVKNLNGDITIKQSYNLTKHGAIAGGVLGTLIGAIFLSPGIGLVAGTAAGAATGSLSDIGIDDQFLEDVGQSLQTKSSALAVLVRRADPDKVLAELEKFEGTVLQTTLSHDDEERLRAALDAAR